MTQLSKTTSTCETQWKMLFLQVFTLIYLTSVCAAQDGTAIPTPDETTYVPPTTYDPPLPSVTSDRSDVYINETVVLKCRISSSSGWTFTWEKDGQQLSQNADFSFQDQNSVLTITASRRDLSGSYTCRGKKQGKSSKTNKIDVKVEKLPAPFLTRQTAWADLFVGEAVTFKCGPNLPTEWTIIWYKNGQLLDKEGPSLDIKSVTENDQANYTCRAKLKSRNVNSAPSNKTNLRVKSNNPKLTLSRSPDFDTFYPEESISFTCNVDVTSEWKYQWFKDGKKITDDSNNRHTITSLKSSDKGQYHCKVQRGTGPLYESNKESVQVADTPTPILKLLSPWSDVFENEVLNFSCEVSSSEWTFTWHKDQTLIPNENKSVLKITAAKVSDKGRYSCKAHHSQRKGVISETSNTFTVSVYDKLPTPTLSTEPSFTPMYVGEIVKLKCTVDVSSGWSYHWYKDVSNLNKSGKELSIVLNLSDNGGYSCEARRGDKTSTGRSTEKQLDVREIPVPRLSQKTQWLDVFQTESVQLSCRMEGSSSWTFVWYKDSKEYHEGTVANSGAEGILSISQASPSHRGQYSCSGRLTDRSVNSTRSSALELHVYDKLPTPTLSRDPTFTPMFAGETVSLKCIVNVSTGWSYHWHKDGKSLNKSGEKLSITLKVSDNGSYSCEAKRGEKTSTGHSKETYLDVRDGKPTVTLLQSPPDKLMHTSDSISFTCHVNISSGWKYTWYKDNKQFKSSGNIYEIASATTSDSGSYKCQIERKTFSSNSGDVKLTIEERPKAKIILLTTWSEVFSTDSLKLQCEVMGSSDLWNYTWYKESVNVSRSLSSTHKVTPNNDPEQSTYTCEGIRTERPMFSQRSDSYRTKNLLLKRRILLSISGCLFFGIIAVFIGCVALRIFRKPVAADDKPEETTLFLTMAQLKDRNDAPCPLVEYITDADVNPPAKEGEENGTSCSETTSLPITSPDEQAATTNGKETTENGGGMVSFLQ